MIDLFTYINKFQLTLKKTDTIKHLILQIFSRRSFFAVLHNEAEETICGIWCEKWRTIQRKYPTNKQISTDPFLGRSSCPYLYRYLILTWEKSWKFLLTSLPGCLHILEQQFCHLEKSASFHTCLSSILQWQSHIYTIVCLMNLSVFGLVIFSYFLLVLHQVKHSSLMLRPFVPDRNVYI